MKGFSPVARAGLLGRSFGLVCAAAYGALPEFPFLDGEVAGQTDFVSIFRNQCAPDALKLGSLSHIVYHDRFAA